MNLLECCLIVGTVPTNICDLTKLFNKVLCQTHMEYSNNVHKNIQKNYGFAIWSTCGKYPYITYTCLKLTVRRMNTSHYNGRKTRPRQIDVTFQINMYQLKHLRLESIYHLILKILDEDEIAYFLKCMQWSHQTQSYDCLHEIVISP